MAVKFFRTIESREAMNFMALACGWFQKSSLMPDTTSSVFHAPSMVAARVFMIVSWERVMISAPCDASDRGTPLLMTCPTPLTKFLALPANMSS